jgi:hypothetical protein
MEGNTTAETVLNSAQISQSALKACSFAALAKESLWLNVERKALSIPQQKNR